MAHSRLPFLYPNLLRSVRACEPTTYRSIRYPPQRTSITSLHSSHKCEQEPTYHKRYGPAAEPRLRSSTNPKDETQPHLPKEAAKESESNGDGKVDIKSGHSNQSSEQDVSNPENKSSSSIHSSSTNIAAEIPFQRIPDNDAEIPESNALVEVGAKNKGSATSSAEDIGSVYHISNPNAASSLPKTRQPSSTGTLNSESQIPPPLSPSPYVHHFDTYTLVKDLGKSGFTEEQSVSMMMAIRGLLADNLDKARTGLISKSDFENETYLFQAACSELRTSLQTSRNAEIQNQRTRRAQLQHELDILTQRMTQDFMGLKDDLKEMFNDQKISTREIQRSQDTAIQELNYQITVSLTSDGKSEAEGLRWILTRRAALAIATSATMIILALRYHSYRVHEREAAAKKEAAAAAIAAEAARHQPEHLSHDVQQSSST